MQDRKGFIWIGTKNGLNRYDGYQFQEFRHDTDKKESLSGNHIQALFEDRDGYIWVGTYEGGLNRLDPKTGNCKVYSYSPMISNGIGSNNIQAIHQDKKGNIWIGTFGGGLSRLNPNTGIFKNFYKTTGLPQGLSSNDVRTIYEDRDGALWLGTLGGGLCRFLPQEEIFTVFTHSDKNLNSLPGDDVYAIREDYEGNIWVGTYGSGLSKYNRRTNSFTNYVYEAGRLGALSSNYITSIEQDPLGYLWIGTEQDGGLNRFDPSCEKFYAYTYNPYNLSSISNNNVNALLADRSGVMWVATQEGGINKFEVQSQVFSAFISQKMSSLFTAGLVTAILEDRERIIWVGTSTDGLYAYNTKNNTYTCYKEEFGDKTLSLTYTINALCEDNKGRIWIGTADNGLFVFDKKQRRFRQFENNLFNSASLSSNGIETIYKDRKGILWIGTYDGGLCRLDPDRYIFSSFQHNPNNPRSLASNTIKVIFEDSQGLMWLGTKDAGLSKFDPKSQIFTNYRSEISSKNKNSAGRNGLPSNSITAITEQGGYLWIGTYEGLCQFDRKGEKFKTLGDEQGLPDNNICALACDLRGNLWISTATKGLTRYSSKNGRFWHFTTEDGIYSNEFQHNCSFINSKGEIYFGGNNHFLLFNPAKVLETSFVSPVYLTSFKLLNEKKNILGVEELSLNYDQTFFEFEFALLNYLDSDHNEYAYKMENFDEEWQFVKNRRFASYTNLEPGEYVFRVKAADKYGIWSTKQVGLKIIIKPAWYHTWWARLAAATLILGSGLSYYRWRIHSIEKQKNLLEELVQERTIELVQKNEEIEAQKDSIEEKNSSLLEAKQIIEEKNEELKAINNDLEKRVEQRTSELKDSNTNLRKINQELDMFIYRASHDIKGPVATLSGLCKVATLDVIDAKALEYFHLLDRTCSKAEQSLVRILGIYEIRNTPVSPEVFSLEEMIDSIGKAHLEKPDHDKIQFEFNYSGSVNIKTDYSLLKTSLNNIIDNAFRYSKKRDNSYIIVEMNQETEATVSIVVRDNGIGIPEELRGKLFTMFFRGTINTSGTGLGLYISKIAIERLGGQIDLLTQHTGDTSFKIILPLVMPPLLTEGIVEAV